VKAQDEKIVALPVVPERAFSIVKQVQKQQQRPVQPQVKPRSMAKFR
jgi:hypothetical protein